MAQLPLSRSAPPYETGSSPSEDSRSLFSDLEHGVVIGSIERVVLYNESTGQCLLDVKVESLKAHVMVTGYASSVYPGQSIYAEVKDRGDRIERPYIADRLDIKPPNTERTLRKFLKSEAMSGLSKNVAKALAETFPENFFAILEMDPARLSEASGVGQKRQMQIIEAWEKYKTLTDFRRFLFEEALPLEWAKTLWTFYGLESQSRFAERPYAVARDHTLNFDLVDGYALRKGFPRDSEERVQGALHDLLQNYYRQGHCAYPESKLLEEAQKKLGVPVEMMENALEIELVENRFVEDKIGETTCIYLHDIWRMERAVAKRLLSFKDKEPPWGWFNIEKLLTWTQNLLAIHLAPLQKEAVDIALSSSLTVITGGPGTGKTTLVKSLTAILQTQFLKFALCSPTGRAAKRLEETTGHPAQTIHRLLKMNALTGEFTFNRENPLEVDLVLVDEVSMVDLSLMYHLLEALPDHCALILVGDADQIPPVGAGNILQSMIESKQFPVVRLKEIFRQSESSLIKINAHRINSGQMPLKAEHTKTDFHYLPVHGVDQAKAMIFDLATRVIPKEYGITDLRDVQILVPLNAGVLGTQQLNLELQQSFAGEALGKTQILGPEHNFTRGDKVMVIKNDYIKNVFNGDVGFIRQIDHPNQFLDIEFDDRTLRFGFDELNRLSLAYAISIHKSQGSEYRAVIVVITAEHLPLAQRHLIYTAVTRGKEHVFLVAEPGALQAAILSDENNQRWQKLTELLQAKS
ncbi:AAA family ATPase [Bdellovibrio sp. HCB337]|uniref:SF1B family DNA helicase RecD2 n=1 Tax=Bdellovibrio sp. HCB337 TaxID=3394358 RepID=UPI0039A6DA2A